MNLFKNNPSFFHWIHKAAVGEGLLSSGEWNPASFMADLKIPKEIRSNVLQYIQENIQKDKWENNEGEWQNLSNVCSDSDFLAEKSYSIICQKYIHPP